MNDKLELKLELEERGLTIIIDVDPAKLEKFTNDVLSGFDDILREIIAIHRYHNRYISLTEEQKVEVDNAIDNLKDG